MARANRIGVAGILAATLATSAVAEPRTFELDPDHTTVAFFVDHVGYAATLGLFAQVFGSFTYDEDTQTLTDLTVEVATASVETLNAARDDHVRSADFLNVGTVPAMTFTADGGDAADATSGTVTGALTLLGETRPLTLAVRLNKAEAYAFGHKRYTLGISAQGELLRSEFGMDYGVANGLVGDRVRIVIETEAMRVGD